MSKEAALNMMTGTVATPEQTPGVVAVDPQTPPMEPLKQELDSARFASVAKKEQEFVRKQAEIKKEREALMAEKAKAEEVMKKAQLFEDTRKTDPVAALKMIGFNETEIFNFLAAQEKKELTPEERAAEAASKAAQERIDAFEKLQKDKEAKEAADRDAGLIQGFKNQMGEIIEGNKEKYEYCAYYGPAAISLAYETVLQIVKDSNGEDIPTAQEAMDMIEELYENEDKKMSSIKKRQPKVEVVEVEKETQDRTRTVTPAVGGTPQRPTITHTRTVTNAATATAAGTAVRRQETREQKKERLIEALRRGKL